MQPASQLAQSCSTRDTCPPLTPAAGLKATSLSSEDPNNGWERALGGNAIQEEPSAGKIPKKDLCPFASHRWFTHWRTWVRLRPSPWWHEMVRSIPSTGNPHHESRCCAGQGDPTWAVKAMNHTGRLGKEAGLARASNTRGQEAEKQSGRHHHQLFHDTGKCVEQHIEEETQGPGKEGPAGLSALHPGREHLLINQKRARVRRQRLREYGHSGRLQKVTSSWPSG